MGKIAEFFNFDNIGGKIKNLAKWSCWITILLIWVAASIAFIALLIEEEEELVLVPLIGAIVGPFLVWVGSWTMYAFGQFVEDIHTMRTKESVQEIKSEYIQRSTTEKEPTMKAKKYTAEGIAPEYEGRGYICPSCHMSMDRIAPCERCGYIPPQAY